MNMKNKEYDNISAKMIEYHNKEVSSLRKNLGVKRFNIKSKRVLKHRDDLENSENVNYNHDFTIEYILLNKFIIDNMFSKEEKQIFYDLIKSNDLNNKILGASVLYTAVENKKKELLDKYENK